MALPIPFDGFGTLEVDLLCADARVVIELDGGQHLADPVAYRRDRRKDQFLQENGYFVLRFLAEDVGKELDVPYLLTHAKVAQPRSTLRLPSTLRTRHSTWDAQASCS